MSKPKVKLRFYECINGTVFGVIELGDWFAGLRGFRIKIGQVRP